MNWFRWDGQLLFLQLHIQPGAKQNSIVGLHGDRLKVKIHAPPVDGKVDGKANAELIDFMSDCFGTGKSAVSVVQGALGRDKTLCIANARHIPDQLSALGLNNRFSDRDKPFKCSAWHIRTG
jgi:uncharacterized protein (TIGR00251 family)